MEAFFLRNYWVLFYVLLGFIAILAFYVGMLYEKQSKGDSVVLSCSNAVLSELKIPLDTLVQKKDTNIPKTIPLQDVSLSKTNDSQQKSVEVKGKFAGSKNGTKYYTLGCSGLNRIKPENIVWFQSVEDATLQGYTAAKC